MLRSSLLVVKWGLIFVLQFNGNALWSQADFSGLWTGTITQDEGGYRSEYKFEMYLHQSGTKIYGRSYVYDDDLYAVMDLTGSVYNDNYLRFQESKIVDFTTVEGMEWCIKRGHLILKRQFGNTKITGVWKGDTGFSACIPGKIFLERTTAQAALD